MIPRFKPYLDKQEILALFRRQENAVETFESEFARTFEAKHGIAFAYGRSALWCFFKAMGIEDAEVIMPAYTCVVVAHAIVLSGNVPRFVDIDLYDYNMNLDEVEEKINENTKAIVATHLFGYPLDVDRLDAIVREAEEKYGHKIWVIQDCAHSFGAKLDGKLVCNQGDVALYGLNISKMITSVFGGMLTLNNDDIASRIRNLRDFMFSYPSINKKIRRSLYLLATRIAFMRQPYGIVHYLQNRTPLLDYLAQAYHLDGIIQFPPDYLDLMLEIEAKVGLVQIKKYTQIVQNRQIIAKYYDEQLKKAGPERLPPIMDGATYSHYPIQVDNRDEVLQTFTENGIELGQVIDYCIPDMAGYSDYSSENDFVNSRRSAANIVNLPISPSLSDANIEYILSVMTMIYQQ